MVKGTFKENFQKKSTHFISQKKVMKNYQEFFGGFGQIFSFFEKNRHIYIYIYLANRFK
jgi:hypothetical protein